MPSVSDYSKVPTWIYDMLLERNILPEFCSMEDIRENARQIEEICLRACSTYKGSTVNSTHSKTPVGGKSLNNGQSNPRPNSQFKGGRSNVNRPNTSRPFNTQTPSRDKPATNPRPFDRSAGKPNGKTSEQRTATQDTSELECYSCHQK